MALIFLSIDEPKDFTRYPSRLVEIERFQHLAQHPRLVLGVQDLEALRQTRLAPMDSQQSMRQSMEGSQPHGTARQSQQGLDAAAHFRRGLVGKRYRENAVRRRTLNLDQPGNPMHQNPGLTAAGARQYQGGTQGRGHGLPLIVIESVK
jgi:hypothetical protein